MTKEEKKDVENSDNGNRGGDSESAGASNGPGGGDSRGESGGPSDGRREESGPSGGESGGSDERSEASLGSEGDDRKANLLDAIRRKRAQGLDQSSGTADGTSPRDHEGTRGTNQKNNGDAGADTGTAPGTNRKSGRSNKQTPNSDNSSSQSPSTNEQSNRVNEKPQGLNIKGVDKIKALAQKAGQVEAPKLKFTWDEKPLSNKEGDEILPKIKGLLEFVFRHADKGITMSNRNKAQAYIWSAIDSEDIEIIASHLVEMGKASKVVATAVRRMTNSYRMLQIGLITLPKFIQTFQFYQANGGFALLGGK